MEYLYSQFFKSSRKNEKVIEWETKKAPYLFWRSNSLVNLADFLNKWKSDNYSKKQLNQYIRSSKPSIEKLKVQNLLNKFVFFIGPMLWGIFLINLFVTAFVDSVIFASTSNILTYLILIIISITFIAPIFYIRYLENQALIDTQEQLSILIYRNPENIFSEKFLKSYLYSDSHGIRWKQFDPELNISLYYPETTAFDFIGLFLSIFSIIFLDLWFIQALILHAGAFNNDNNRDVSLFLVDISLLIWFNSLVLFGIMYGKRRVKQSDFRIQIKSSITQKDKLVFAIITFFTIATLIVGIFLDRNAFGNIFFIFILSQTPILSYFITIKAGIISSFSDVKKDVIKLLRLRKYELSLASQVHEKTEVNSIFLFNYLQTVTSLSRIENQPNFPTTRLRSLTLMFTVFISIISPIITALNSSAHILPNLINLFSIFDKL